MVASRSCASSNRKAPKSAVSTMAGGLIRHRGVFQMKRAVARSKNRKHVNRRS